MCSIALAAAIACQSSSSLPELSQTVVVRYRQFCGLKPISHWDQLVGLVSNRTVAAFQRLYDTPEDLELFSAGLAENPVPGGLLGPTFTCIIGRQFHNIRVGDR